MNTHSFARRALVAIVGAVMAGAATTVWLAACFDIYRPPTVASFQPLDREAFVKGELGVLRPTFARRYLVQAYRVLNGVRPLDEATLGPMPASVIPAGQTPPRTSIEEWRNARQRIPGGDTPPQFLPLYYDDSSVGRRIDSLYSTFPNCQSDAFRTATRTLEDRIATFGASSTTVIEWTRAQDAVFANCSGEQLVLPAPPSAADPQRHADFEYQTAASYFYATLYEEAARRFRQIALDQASPWQPYGRYLAARATIRQATVTDSPEARREQLLAAADVELQAVLSDPRASTLHDSARGLLGYVHARLRPSERLTELSSSLEKAMNPTRQDVEDYRWLLEKVAYCCTFHYDSVADFDGLVKSGDLTDWIITTQASGDETLGRALQRWTDTQSPAWLVSVLWKIPPAHSATANVLLAAAAIPRQSPAYATVAFLRVRLMLARGERNAARALLAELPVKAQPGFPEESINLLKAARLQLANSLDELLVNSVRTVLDPAMPTSGNRLLEDDASELLTYRLPLSRLVDASRSKLLPDRIRYRLAAAALSRALVLRRDDVAREAATALSSVAPAARRDLDRYLGATSAEERHRAGLLIMARTLGMHAYVPGRRDFGTIPVHDWMSEDLVGSWWCTTVDGRLTSRLVDEPSGVESMFHQTQTDDFPSFLTGDERADVREEIAALVKLGHPQGYLAEEAIKWAQEAPQDLRAAEALATVVRRGRWSCSVPASSRRAFQTLHRVFPTSVWAQRTRYWYAGHQ